jgi:hypothetical protein
LPLHYCKRAVTAQKHILNILGPKRSQALGSIVESAEEEALRPKSCALSFEAMPA